MKNIQIILNAILSKNVFEYFLIDKHLNVTNFSSAIENYLEVAPKIGNSVLDYLPEFVGAESEIIEIFDKPSATFILESIHKNEFYVNLSVEYYDQGNALVLLHNITDVTRSKQQLLQCSNESILLNNTLQKILDSQNALLFVTNNNQITYVNEQFTEYFGLKQVFDVQRRNLNIYKYLDNCIESYDDLFERVNSKEEYIMINDDTFILQATCIEARHKLFTLSKITKFSNEMYIDTLTGAYKKTYLNRYVEKMIENREDGVMVVMDLDDFKHINDTYGHQVGDEVLQEFSELMMSNIRSHDIFARWGGEEFLLLLQNVDIENALQKIEGLRKLVSEHTFKHIGHMTSSFGVSWKEESDDFHSFLQRADKALYEAKANGKNQIVFKKI